MGVYKILTRVVPTADTGVLSNAVSISGDGHIFAIADKGIFYLSPIRTGTSPFHSRMASIR